MFLSAEKRQQIIIQKTTSKWVISNFYQDQKEHMVSFLISKPFNQIPN